MTVPRVSYSGAQHSNVLMFFITLLTNAENKHTNLTLEQIKRHMETMFYMFFSLVNKNADRHQICIWVVFDNFPV